MPITSPTLVTWGVTFDVAFAIRYLGVINGNVFYLYTGSVAGNTQAEYDALTWNDARAKPTWADVLNYMEPAVRWNYDFLFQGQGGYDLYLNTQAKIATLAKNTAVPSTPTRALNTSFIPNATYPSWVCYTIEITCTASLTGGQTGGVELRSDTAATPTTVRASVSNANSVSLAIALTAINTQRATVSYLVPAGHSVKLVSSSTGSPSISIINQVEVALGA